MGSSHQVEHQMGNIYIFIFVCKSVRIYIETTILKKEQNIPLVKQISMDIKWKMVGYDCILFSNIFHILSCVLLSTSISYHDKISVTIHAQPLELQH